ncbi:endopeptidase [Mycobacteroides abscessus subsp. massiliense]|uniref:S1 family peptidase n=1 Tax=Mycobacteroides abscessus TaxID=36809 RepID=UPI0009A80F3F|nr:S1 family peptidase [Mycobacteroides abscessus]SLE99709.1 endopeptidase [Mycobacteroides abscessus subsp. massiliense]
MSARTFLAALAASAAACTAVAAAPAAAAEQPATAAPGMVIYQPTGSGTARCTLGFAARNARGDRLAVTAGHCGQPGAPVTDVYGRPVGRYVAAAGDDISAHRYGYAIIALAPGVNATNHVTPTVAVDRPATAAPGDAVCLFGTTTGVQCGTVTDPKAGIIKGFLSNHGDSGGPIIRPRDNALVGILVAHDNAVRETYYQPLDALVRAAAATPIGERLGPVVTYASAPESSRA